jgi:GGDEF domain-containing protein
LEPSEFPIDPKTTLRRLGESHSVLDGLLRLVRLEWNRFRDRPSAEALERLSRLLDGAGHQLQALRVLLDEAPDGRPLPPDESHRRLHDPGFRERRGDQAGSPRSHGVETAPPREPAAPADSEDAWSSADGAPEAGGDGRDGRGPSFPAFRDQETGLFSREGFDAVASGELKRCRRYERPFSVVLVQLGVGRAERLRPAAATLRRTLRESDLAGRHVDRTFVVALAETPLTEARIVARRIVRSLDRTGSWGDAARVGVAGHPIDGDTLPSLFDVGRGQLALPVTDVLAPNGTETAG